MVYCINIFSRHLFGLTEPRTERIWAEPFPYSSLFVRHEWLPVKRKKKIIQGYIRNTEEIKFLILEGKRTLAYFRVILSYCLLRTMEIGVTSFQLNLEHSCALSFYFYHREASEITESSRGKTFHRQGLSIYVNNYFKLKKFLYLVRRFYIRLTRRWF